MAENLATSANNIRYNGTGRVYVGDVGGASLVDLGELDGFKCSPKVTKDQLKTTRSADRATILEVEKDREVTLGFGLQEQTEHNVRMALMGSTIASDNQVAGNVTSDEVVLVDDQYVDLGHLNVFITKLTGTITGALAPGDIVTGENSAATGDIAWTESGLVELVNVSGTFVSGEKAELDAGNYITVSGVEVAEDVVVVNADVDSGTPSVRYVNGTDYDLDPDYGYLRMLSAGTLNTPGYISYDYEAVTRNYTHAMSAASVQKKVVFVTDKDDQGLRFRHTFHKVNISMNGDWSLIGDGPSTLPMEGTVLKDTTQPTGQEYFKTEIMG